MKRALRVLGGAAIVFLTVQPALAGPGGKIARAAFETFWGRVVLGALTVLFLPLIVLVSAQESLAGRRAQRDLAFVARCDGRFDWLSLKGRAADCFQRVHAGWQDGDLGDADRWMTSWYRRNQQGVFLDRWKADGLTNVCRVRRIKRVRPLLFAHRNDEGIVHERSRIVLGITATLQDYLERASTGEIVEGSRKWKDVETVWTLTFTRGEWKVPDIEDDSTSLAHAMHRKRLPAIESTMPGRPDA